MSEDLDFDADELAMLRQLFRSEAHDALEVVTARILSSGTARPSVDALGEMMRVTHTIKGSAGTVGLLAMVDLAHRLESAFAVIGRDPAVWNAVTADMIVEITDCLRGYVDQLAADPAQAEETAAQLRIQIHNLTNSEPPERPSFSEMERPSFGRIEAGESMAIPTIVTAGEPEPILDMPSDGVLVDPRATHPTLTAPSLHEARHLRVEPERIDNLM
ncbi:MAG TPA: Hpt domain-containing protein, partial [Kofleriaceae bacterium]